LGLLILKLSRLVVGRSLSFEYGWVEVGQVVANEHLTKADGMMCGAAGEGEG